MSRGPSDPVVRNDKPTVKSFFFSTQGKTISVRAKPRCGACALLARTSIKSAGVAELIGRLVQGHSDLVMQEESLVKLERAPFARRRKKSSGILDPLVDHPMAKEKSGWFQRDNHQSPSELSVNYRTLDTKFVSTRINLHRRLILS